MVQSNQLESTLAAFSSLKTARAPWEPWWDALREYVLPRRVSEEEESSLPGGTAGEHLYDTTAVEACQKLASGHMSYITPSHEVWFKWAAPDGIGGDEAESWYNECSEIALKELSVSNFYTEIHECFLDRVAFGTGSLYSGVSSTGALMFTHIPCGRFCCAENEEGKVDTYFREFSLSAYQAERMFGRRNLGPKARKIIEEGNDLHTAVLRFLHAVRPRVSRNRKREDALNMPYESLYISLDDRTLTEEGGYREFPYLVSRFLKWGDTPYGLAPGRLVFPEIRQAQFLNRILDTLGEVAAFPRILELANQIGEVDMRAGGRTVITPEAASLHLPKEWATQGRYDIGMDRLDKKQDAIRRAFYLPMLELWGSRAGSMTATEVMARENERVLMFSPSFTLFVSDLYPIMCRIFALLFRQGKFPRPPEAVMKKGADGLLGIGEPRVVYQSRIALVLRRIQSEGIDRSLQRLGMMSSYSPGLLDHVDWDACFRMACRFDGAPEKMLKSMKEVRKIRREREEESRQTVVGQNGESTQMQQGESGNSEALASLLAELTGQSASPSVSSIPEGGMMP